MIDTTAATEEPIRDVSDTALWMAMYRAEETDRKDAIFRDPYARRLAGERGRRIVDSIPRNDRMSWPLIVRTRVIDDWVLSLARLDGVNTVLDLATGLDTRPWRLSLPAETEWVDVDLPGMLEHKRKGMMGELPRCRYTQHAADIRDPAALRSTLDRFTSHGRRVLVLTEGILIYLTSQQVEGIARELAGHPSVRYWITDLASAMLLEFTGRRWRGPSGMANAPFRFAPPEGTAFFARFGWREREYRALMNEAKRLHRAPGNTWVWALRTPFMSRRKREQLRRFLGCVMFERANTRAGDSGRQPS